MPSHLRSRKRRVLVIEDDQAIRQAILQSLLEAGIEVDISLDGVMGLKMALDHDFDAIVLDWRLPGRDGLDVLTQLRQVKTTPVILATACSSVENRVLGLNSGADDYLVKPFALMELVARLRVLFRKSPRNR